MWPRWILLQTMVFAVRLTNILNTSQRLVNKNSLTWWLRLQNVLKMPSRRICETDVLKTSWQDILKMSWRRLEDVFKTSRGCHQDVFARRLEDVLNTSWRCLGKTSWRCLEDVSKTSWKRLEDVLKAYGQDKYIGLDQDVLKTYFEDEDEKRLQDVFKTSSSRRMFAGRRFTL